MFNHLCLILLYFYFLNMFLLKRLLNHYAAQSHLIFCGAINFFGKCHKNMIRSPVSDRNFIKVLHDQQLVRGMIPKIDAVNN